MAATSQPLATATAIRVLQQGGNAIDAAIAANAVLGVVEPMSCGAGGRPVRDRLGREDQEARRLERQRPGSPAPPPSICSSRRGSTRHSHVRALELVGPRLRRRLGPASLAVRHQALARAARAGDRLRRERVSGQRDHRRRLAGRRAEPQEDPHLGRSVFFPAGHAPGAGIGLPERRARPVAPDDRRGRPRCVLPGTDRRGDRQLLSSRWAACSRCRISPSTRATFVDPVSTNYRGYDVWELPPNGQGIAALQMLNLLEPYDLKSLGPQSAESLHLMIEAKKLAYEDRAKYYADPEFAHLPVAALISKSYAASGAA